MQDASCFDGINFFAIIRAAGRLGSRGTVEPYRMVGDVFLQVGKDQEQFEHPIALLGGGIGAPILQVFNDRQGVRQQPLKSVGVDRQAVAALLEGLTGADKCFVEKVFQAEPLAGKSRRNDSSAQRTAATSGQSCVHGVPHNPTPVGREDTTIPGCQEKISASAVARQPTRELPNSRRLPGSPQGLTPEGSMYCRRPAALIVIARRRSVAARAMVPHPLWMRPAVAGTHFMLAEVFPHVAELLALLGGERIAHG